MFFCIYQHIDFLSNILTFIPDIVGYFVSLMIGHERFVEQDDNIPVGIFASITSGTGTVEYYLGIRFGVANCGADDIQYFIIFIFLLFHYSVVGFELQRYTLLLGLEKKFDCWVVMVREAVLARNSGA